MKKKSDGLLFRFSILFLVFTVVMLVLSGVATYLAQMRTYSQECRDRLHEVGNYLEALIQGDGEDFITYQNYFMSHYQESNIPYNFTEYLTAEEEYEEMLAKAYPGKTLWEDLDFDDLTPEIQEAYFKYTHEYWFLTFEKSRSAFHLPYTYYLVPVETPGRKEYDVYYMIDAERVAKEGSDGKYLYLGDEYHHTPEQQPIEWKVWSTGQKTEEFQEWDNEYGHTYTYYVPLIINGQKLGLICAEMEVERINRGILLNTLLQTSGIGVVLILCVLLVLGYINRNHIARIVNLSENVKRYSTDKDAAIAREIEKDAIGRDELSSLATQTSDMVLELDNYIKSLLSATNELSKTRQHAEEMQVLATKDALTGIRNKAAYDNEVRQLERKLSDGMTEFGIVMVDLNYLKRINDTYGHEQGNIAIRKLCHIVCVVFQHSPVFRVGGDEFVVVLRGKDYEMREELVEKFNSSLERLRDDDTLEQWEKVSAAVGMAIYEPDKDNTVDNVFKRADKAMYQRKREMKAVRTD